MTGISLKKKILFCFIISISIVLLTTVLLEMSLRVAALFVGLRPVTPYTGETNTSSFVSATLTLTEFIIPNRSRIPGNSK